MSDEPKVGLIGFYAYKYSSNSGLLKNEYLAELDYSASLKSILEFGKPIEELELKDGYKKIKDKDVVLFIKSYLSKVKQSGIKELEKFIEVKGEQRKVKNYIADVYVIGIFNPHYKEVTRNLTAPITGIFGILTLGTLPVIEEYITISQFLIFDKDMKFIGEFRYPSKYKIVSAWWMFPNEGFQTFFNQSITVPLRAFEPDAFRFRNDFKILYEKELKDYLEKARKKSGFSV